MNAALQSAPLAEVAQALRALLPEGVACAVRRPEARTAPPLPEEMPAIVRACPSRRMEFAAGRAAARAALAQIGLPGRAIPQSADRAPVWPKGAIGSIAHCSGCCLAAAAPSARVRALGVDVEPATPLAADLFELICTPRELAELLALPQAEREIRAKLVFSAKESVFKALYPLIRHHFGFDAVEVSVNAATGRFAATILQPLAPFRPGDRLTGGNAVAQGLIITTMVLDA